MEGVRGTGTGGARSGMTTLEGGGRGCFRMGLVEETGEHTSQGLCPKRKGLGGEVRRGKGNRGTQMGRIDQIKVLPRITGKVGGESRATRVLRF